MVLARGGSMEGAYPYKARLEFARGVLGMADPCPEVERLRRLVEHIGVCLGCVVGDMEREGSQRYVTEYETYMGLLEKMIGDAMGHVGLGRMQL